MYVSNCLIVMPHANRSYCFRLIPCLSNCLPVFGSVLPVRHTQNGNPVGALDTPIVSWLFIIEVHNFNKKYVSTYVVSSHVARFRSSFVDCRYLLTCTCMSCRVHSAQSYKPCKGTPVALLTVLLWHQYYLRKLLSKAQGTQHFQPPVSVFVSHAIFLLLYL